MRAVAAADTHQSVRLAAQPAKSACRRVGESAKPPRPRCAAQRAQRTAPMSDGRAAKSDVERRGPMNALDASGRSSDSADRSAARFRLCGRDEDSKRLDSTRATLTHLGGRAQGQARGRKSAPLRVLAGRDSRAAPRLRSRPLDARKRSTAAAATANNRQQQQQQQQAPINQAEATCLLCCRWRRRASERPSGVFACSRLLFVRL